MLALAVMATGTVAAFDRDPAKDFGSSLYDASNHEAEVWSDGATTLPPLASVQGQTIPPHGVSGLAEVLGSPAVEGTLVEAWSPLRKVAESRVDSERRVQPEHTRGHFHRRPADHLHGGRFNGGRLNGRQHRDTDLRRG